VSRYTKLFEMLKSVNQKAFIPFVTVGDPDLEMSQNIIENLIACGADALELGLPFSDPVADGPIIQAANLRALSKGVYTRQALKLISNIRSRHPQIPIGLLSYTNLVVAMGKENFFKLISDAGVDSLLLADLPFVMTDWLRSTFVQYNIAQVLIAPPNADQDLLKNIAKFSQGYTYLLGRSGVTGINVHRNEDLSQNIELLKKYNSAPIVQGFGISDTKDVKQAIAAGVDGIIVGSAIIKIIQENVTNKTKILEKTKAFASEIKLATVNI